MTEIQIHDSIITITRRDISPGYQLAQSVHSIAQFAHSHTSTFTKWITGYSNLISLSVDNEVELMAVYDSIEAERVLFKEPDLNNEVTAICIFGTTKIRKLLSSLPLALKEVS